MEIRIDENKKYQIFEGFGASGAWWAQEVGGWTHPAPDGDMSVRDKISQLLYSPSACRKSHFEKMLHKKFSSTFFKRWWGIGVKPRFVLFGGRNLLEKSAGGAKNVPVGHF